MKNPGLPLADPTNADPMTGEAGTERNEAEVILPVVQAIMLFARNGQDKHEDSSLLGHSVSSELKRLLKKRSALLKERNKAAKKLKKARKKKIKEELDESDSSSGDSSAPEEAQVKSPKAKGSMGPPTGSMAPPPPTSPVSKKAPIPAAVKRFPNGKPVPEWKEADPHAVPSEVLQTLGKSAMSLTDYLNSQKRLKEEVRLKAQKIIESGADPAGLAVFFLNFLK